VIFGDIPRDPIPLNSTRFVAFDLETTGVAMHKDRIVEIALVAWKKGSKKETFSTLVNPGVPVSQRSTDFHCCFSIRKCPMVALRGYIQFLRHSCKGFFVYWIEHSVDHTENINYIIVKRWFS